MPFYVRGGSRDGGRRLPVRLIIGVIIAGIGLLTWMSQRQENPVTGEVQHVAMSVDQEKSLGLQAAPEMAEQMGGVIDPDADPRAATVERIGYQVVRESDASRSPYVGNFHFYLLDDPETINAFALPGGQVFITLGLYRRLEDEAELAGVLGHEIGHVINRHAAEHMATGQLGQMLTAAVAVGASDDRDRGRSAAMAAALVNQMLQLKYSRSDESESDSTGLAYMAQAGYDPSAMLDVMRILEEAAGSGGQPEFLLTHPYPKTRIERIQSFLAENYPDGVPSDLTRGRPLGESYRSG